MSALSKFSGDLFLILRMLVINQNFNILNKNCNHEKYLTVLDLFDVYLEIFVCSISRQVTQLLNFPKQHP